MKKNKPTGAKLLAIILCVALLSSYLIYQVVLASKSDMETQFALKETVYKTINTKCFVIRDEEFIKYNIDGTTVSFAQNGERVGRGDTVSVVFNSAEDASSYHQINEIEKEIQHYKELSGQANFQTLNIESLNRKIENELTDFLEYRDVRDYSKASLSADIFRDSVTGKQIATGITPDFSKELASLQSQLDSLKEKQYSYKEIKTDNAGYYINGADGYESTLKFDKIDEIKAEDVKKATQTEPVSVSSDTVGRIVSSFTWYIACVVPTEDTVNLTKKNALYLNFPYEGIEKLPVTLFKIGERGDKETMLILSCDLMNEQLSDLRIEDIEIITEEYTGYKISNSAIRTVEGEKGVYVVRGNLVGFRKIHILYSTDTFSIVDNPEGSSDYIKLYDKVVTKGVELYDNKLL